MFTYVSEEPAVFIFYPSSETSTDIYRTRLLSSALKLGAERSSEVTVNIYQTIWRHILEGSNLHSQILHKHQPFAFITQNAKVMRLTEVKYDPVES
jgi:hypothetical protein